MKVTGGWEKPYPDENAYSIISRMAMYIITPSHYLTGARIFERNRPLAQYVVKPLRKSDLARWEMDEGEGFYRRHVLDHSSDPVYGTILVRDRLQSLMDMIRTAVSSAESAMNVYYGGVTINVYGHEGQDISALADEIEERININMTRRKAAFI